MKIFPILLFTLLFCFRNDVFAQKKNVWSTLGLMKYERQFSEHDGINSNRGGGSKFRPLIEALDGEEIEVTGYIIPLSGKKAQSHLMFSMYPFATCFFCGNAGPETIMDIKLKTKLSERIKQDDRMTFRGKLKLNATDLYYLNYILEDAEVVEK